MNNDPLGLFDDDVPQNDPLGLFDNGESAYQKHVPDVVKNFVGGNDAALNMAAQIPAYVGSGLAGLGTLMTGQGVEKAGQAVKDFQEWNFGLGAAKPFTEQGKQAVDMIGEGTEFAKDKAGRAGYAIGGELGRTNAEIATEAALNFLPIPGGKGVHKLGQAIEKKFPVSRVEKEYKPGKADELIQEEKKQKDDIDRALSEMSGERAFNDMGAELAKGQMDEVNFPPPGAAMDNMAQVLGEQRPAEAAQRAIDARQAQMEFEVKKQAGLDFNAAERARQENAPTGYDDYRMSRLKDKFRREIEARNEQTVNQARGDLEGPIYVDPQGQAFRGDPAHPDAKLALERQTEAMDRELTHLQGKGTPEGSPLRPLTDPTRINSAAKGGKQRGAVDTRVLREAVEAGFKKVAEALDRIHIPNALAKDAYPTMVELYQKTEDPQVISFARNELRKLGYPREVLGALDEAIVAAHKLKLGQHEASMEKVVPFRRKNQQGSINLRMLVPDLLLNMAERKPSSGTGVKAESIPPEQRPARPDTIDTPRSPENIEARNKQRRFANHFPGKDKALDEFDVIRTKEEALALAKDAKDISKDFGQKDLGSGINFHAAMSNNPILKFARTLAKDVRAYADGFSQRYITDNKVGLTPLWSDMTKNERIGVMDALMAGDKHQMKINDPLMDKLGFNDVQRQFIKTFYEADNRLFTDWNKALNEVGLKTVEERVGHFPGIFTGSYKTLVMQDKKVIGVIASDTVYQQKQAQKYVKEQFPSATFVEQKRQSLAGTTKRYYSDIFSGMNDVLEMLGNHDPRFKEVQDIVSGAIRASNNRLFNFNVHELNKKGVFGNEGNKPWKDAAANADDAFKALVRYFEEGAMHHALQVPMKELREIATDPATAHLPNTKAYLDKYTKKMLGDDLSPLGAAINTILDTPFKVLGVGPAVPLKLAGSLKNNMSQLFMGYGNYMFTAAQLVQPIQTGLPFMQLAANRLGVSPVEVTASLGRGGAEFMRVFSEDVMKKDLGAPQHMRDAYQYAKDRGLLTFSELEKAYQGTQGKISRGKDQLAEFNMKIGEQATRTPMFMAFTDLLVNAGIEPKRAMPIAENLTQFSMIDYHLWERPMVYSKLGVMGGFASGLTTFKHGLASQQAYLLKESGLPKAMTLGFVDRLKPHQGAQVSPALLAVVSMLTFAGITGSPFYSELDTVVKAITNQMGEQKSIRELFLQNSPEWLNSGVVSNATGLNIQGKFSSADMIPDNFARAASPHIEAASKIIGSAIDMAKNGADPQSVRNFLTSVTPAGWKGAMENAVSRDEKNQLIGKDGLPLRERTDAEWRARGLTGLRSQQEAIERNELWDQRQKERSDIDRRKEISAEYKRRIINDTMTSEAQAKLEREYEARKGDPTELIKLWQEAYTEKSKTEKERLEGTPNSLRGINRFNYYNK